MAHQKSIHGNSWSKTYRDCLEGVQAPCSELLRCNSPLEHVISE
jgi:hypothetical protein